MKNTWAGINNLINKKRKNPCKITALKNGETGQIIREPSALPNVLNKYFASIGHKLGTNMTDPDIHFTDYLKDTQIRESFLVQSLFETLQYCDEWRKFTSVSQSVCQSVSQSVSQS